jgi:hypothetical protein
MWVYRENDEPMIIPESEYENYKADGWLESPASFITLESMGIDKEKLESGDISEAFKGQQVQESIHGVVESLNGMLNLEKMNKAELVSFAKKHAGIKAKSKERKPDLVTKIKAELEI